MSYYQDKELVCVKENCQTPFVWTGGEQKFMQKLVENGKIDRVIEPKLCPSCRAKRKERINRAHSRNGE